MIDSDWVRRAEKWFRQDKMKIRKVALMKIG